jgi:hypothetical protein
VFTHALHITYRTHTTPRPTSCQRHCSYHTACNVTNHPVVTPSCHGCIAAGVSTIHLHSRSIIFRGRHVAHVHDAAACSKGSNWCGTNKVDTQLPLQVHARDPANLPAHIPRQATQHPPKYNNILHPSSLGDGTHTQQPATATWLDGTRQATWHQPWAAHTRHVFMRQ